MNKIFEPATDFKFTPADFVPFKDRELCEKLRRISGTDLEKHPNPNFKIKVMMNIWKLLKEQKRKKYL